MKNENFFWEEALKEAKKASSKEEVPIGALIVCDNKIIARTHNATEKNQSFTAHAELLALLKASRVLKTKYLSQCDLYITLEPCLMCVTAARLSRIRNIYFLLKSEKFGRRGKAYFKTPIRKVRRGALSQSYLQILQSFFRSRR